MTENMISYPRGDVSALSSQRWTMSCRRPLRSVMAARAVHGSAVAALFAAALDKPGANVARITMDLFGTNPLGALQLTVSEIEGGRRVRRRVALLQHEDRVVARAVALLIAESPDLDFP